MVGENERCDCNRSSNNNNNHIKIITESAAEEHVDEATAAAMWYARTSPAKTVPYAVCILVPGIFERIRGRHAL